MRLVAISVAAVLALSAIGAAWAEDTKPTEILGAGSGETRDKSCAAARADAISKAGGKKLTYPTGCNCTHKGALYSCNVKGVPQ